MLQARCAAVSVLLVVAAAQSDSGSGSWNGLEEEEVANCVETGNTANDCLDTCAVAAATVTTAASGGGTACAGDHVCVAGEGACVVVTVANCVETGNTANDCLDTCAVAAATVTTAASGGGTACAGDYTCLPGDGACPPPPPPPPALPATTSLYGSATFPLDAVPEGDARDTFEQQFKTATAALHSGIDASRVTVDDIQPGSVVVDFTMVVDSTDAAAVQTEVHGSSITVGTATSEPMTAATTNTPAPASVPRTPSPAPVAAPKEDRIWMVAVGLVLGAIVMSLVAYVVYSKCCKSADKDAGGGGQNPVHQQGPPQPGPAAPPPSGMPPNAANQGSVNHFQLGGAQQPKAATPDGYYQPAAAAAPAVQQSDWILANDPNSGKKYYVNMRTRETKWQDPDTSGAEWQAAQAKDGRMYWYSKRTRQTTWEDPTVKAPPTRNTTPPRRQAPPLQQMQQAGYGGGQAAPVAAGYGGQQPVGYGGHPAVGNGGQLAGYGAGYGQQQAPQNMLGMLGAQRAGERATEQIHLGSL